MCIWTSMSLTTTISTTELHRICDLKRSGTRRFWTAIAPNTSAASSDSPFRQLTAYRCLFLLSHIGQNDVNKTIYNESLKYEYQGQTHTTTVQITYYPTDETAPLPQPPTVKQDLSSNYYYVYNYNRFYYVHQRSSSIQIIVQWPNQHIRYQSTCFNN